MIRISLDNVTGVLSVTRRSLFTAQGTYFVSILKCVIIYFVINIHKSLMKPPNHFIIQIYYVFCLCSRHNISLANYIRKILQSYFTQFKLKEVKSRLSPSHTHERDKTTMDEHFMNTVTAI